MTGFNVVGARSTDEFKATLDEDNLLNCVAIIEALYHLRIRAHRHFLPLY